MLVVYDAIVAVYPAQPDTEVMVVTCLAQKPSTTFVAIKNGMHQEEGFAFFTPGAAKFAPVDRSHVKEIYGAVMAYFGVK